MPKAEEYGTPVEQARHRVGWLSPTARRAAQADGAVPAGESCAACAFSLLGPARPGAVVRRPSLRCGQPDRYRGWATPPGAWCPQYMPEADEPWGDDGREVSHA